MKTIQNYEISDTTCGMVTVIAVTEFNRNMRNCVFDHKPILAVLSTGAQSYDMEKPPALL